VFEQTGRFSEAVESMETALKLQPRDPALWACQGRILEETNRMQEAIIAYSREIELLSGVTNIAERSNALLKRARG
jgi:cytochrome c-type biogenesis protein CcmH/NrfG